MEVFLPPSRKVGFAEKLTVAVFDINSSVAPGQLSSAALNNFAERYSDFEIPAKLRTITRGDKIMALNIGLKIQGAVPLLEALVGLDR